MFGIFMKTLFRISKQASFVWVASDCLPRLHMDFLIFFTFV